MPRNLYEVFHATAERQPQHPAIVGPADEDVLTYAALDDRIRAASERLRRAGVQPGHCVGLHCPSGVEYIVLTYAVWRCGGCIVPIPAELTSEEKRQICREIRLASVITTAGDNPFLAPFRAGNETELAPRIALVPVVSPREHPSGFHEVHSAFIRFTSGTTGASKGVVLSHETVLERIHAANDVLRLGPADRIVWMLSMSYHFTVSIVG